MNVISRLTKHVVDTTWGSLTPDVIEVTKKQILDTLGVGIAGASHKAVEAVVTLVKEWGGREESTILSYGGRVPCVNAALVNAYLATITDFSDTDDEALLHASQANIPACFAMAERIGKVNGRDFLVAVAIGYDIACRLSRAVWYHFPPSWPWDPNPVFSFFGCAASAGKLLNLGWEQVRHGFSLALQQVSGLQGGILDGMNSKGLSVGRAAAGGLSAVLLAERGLTGISDPFEGSRGLYATFFRSVYSAPMITADLGKTFAAKTCGFKPYPCCAFIGSPVDATLALVRRNDIKSGDVAEVNIQCGRDVYHIIAEPRDMKVKPSTSVAAEFSLPWAVANAICHHRVGIEQFAEEAIHRDEEVLELAQKVHCRLPYVPGFEDDAPAALVKIRTRDGKMYSESVETRYGHWKNTMSWRDISAKFKECCWFSAKPIPEERQNNAIQMVDRIEDMTDVGEIIRLLG